jgi:uncharacterized protein YunC (DUF1805 family)
MTKAQFVRLEMTKAQFVRLEMTKAQFVTVQSSTTHCSINELKIINQLDRAATLKPNVLLNSKVHDEL